MVGFITFLYRGFSRDNLILHTNSSSSNSISRPHNSTSGHHHNSTSNNSASSLNSTINPNLNLSALPQTREETLGKNEGMLCALMRQFPYVELVKSRVK